jgi:hypothetical protein
MGIYAKGDEMKVCNRCGQDSVVSNVGFKLLHFVCNECRNDNNLWDFKMRETVVPIKVEDMEACMPEPENAVKLAKQKHKSAWNYKQSRGSKQDYRVVWADGVADKSDRCDMCLRHDCHFPVHSDKYKEVSKRSIQN